MSNVIKSYARFIAEQESRKVFTSSKIDEAEDPHGDMEDKGFDHIHTTSQGHHVYAHEETDRGTALHYAVKHPSGKVTHHSVEHGGRPVTDKHLGSKQSWHKVSKHDIPHDGVRKAIHDDVKAETSHL